MSRRAMGAEVQEVRSAISPKTSVLLITLIWLNAVNRTSDFCCVWRSEGVALLLERERGGA
jgi:hypothetical protein